MRTRSILLLAGVLGLTGCNPFEPEIYGVCEEALKARLRAPSTYKRIEISNRSREMSRDDLLIFLRDSEASSEQRATQLNDFDGGGVRPMHFDLRITYDAANVYNTPIRDSVSCEFIGNKDSRPSSLLVKIDGKTSTEWVLSGG